MHIGHINLEKRGNNHSRQFIALVEALQQQGTRQYVIVRSVELAKRLDLVDEVTVGPVVRSALTAACLMPHVDVVHIHNTTARQAGLILKLTRSIPFILSNGDSVAQSKNPIMQSIYNRASGLIADGNVDEHLQLYRHAADKLRVPTMLL